MIIKKILFVTLVSTFALQASAATILIQNNDGANEGFNDPNAPAHANQIGATNTANTLGALRLEVFTEAAKVWGDILNSNIAITVGATFDDDLVCAANSATLGQAGPTGSQQGFANSEAGVAYPVALAESLSGSNLNSTSVEITAKFNSKVDTNDPDCMGGGGFYYGLDDNVPVGTSALFPVVLHELGHGLGFLSFVNNATGGFNTFSENPDTFSRNLQDLETGKTWVSMTNPERLASSLNEPDLVWTGAKATEDRGLHLNPAPELAINAPAPAGTFEAALGQQSAAIPGGGITAAVVEGNSVNDLGGDPADGCSQIQYGGTFTGKIVLLDSTVDCSAAIQAFYTQFEGAVGLLIADTTGAGLADVSGGLLNPITVAYIGIHKSEADQLRTNIGAANATIQNSATKFVGENQGKLKMYAPPVLESGSSVSHWSKSATPDLLMEPALGALDFEDVDLTAAAFRDIGWSVNIPGGVVEEIFKDGFE